MSKRAAAKEAMLKLKQPESSSDTDGEEELDVVVSPITTASSVTDSYLENQATSTETTSITSKQLEAVNFIDGQSLIGHSVELVIENIQSEVEELNSEIDVLLEQLGLKKGELKEKRSILKKWLKRVQSPTTAENAQLAVVVGGTNRQLHNDEDNQLYYRTGEKNTKTLVRLSARKVSTKSVRDAKKNVVDGKTKISVHVKDATVTLADLIRAGEEELVEQLQQENN